MRDNLFLIWGGRSEKRGTNVAQPSVEQRPELNLEILKKSPCLHCELFARGAACSYVKKCSKIDEFQRMAAAHCTLHKSYDIRSMG